MGNRSVYAAFYGGEIITYKLLNWKNVQWREAGNTGEKEFKFHEYVVL